MMTVTRELYFFVKSRSFLNPDGNLKKPKSPVIFGKPILAPLIVHLRLSLKEELI